MNVFLMSYLTLWIRYIIDMK